jgi:ribulose-5-phosphate 4-epimerase/fuculose-1-phosphate aldolase
MNGEGYIKYQQHWQHKPIQKMPGMDSLIQTRDALFRRSWIGVDEEGIGYGNISIRVPGSNQCLITATQTGRFPKLQADQISLVTAIQIETNELWCEGLLPASAEAMSHMAIYQVRPDVQSVVHIHDAYMWESLFGLAPTTETDIQYGSPEMAYALQELVIDFSETNEIIVAGGHIDGLFVCGATPEEAFDVLNNWSGANK